MNNSWKDPDWTSVRKLRRGIEGEDKELRSLVFGKNVIDIEEKTVMQLLIDEACSSPCLPEYKACEANKIANIGISSFLCFPNREFDLVVYRRVLLLCGLHIYHFSCQHS